MPSIPASLKTAAFAVALIVVLKKVAPNTAASLGL